MCFSPRWSILAPWRSLILLPGTAAGTQAPLAQQMAAYSDLFSSFGTLTRQNPICMTLGKQDSWVDSWHTTDKQQQPSVWASRWKALAPQALGFAKLWFMVSSMTRSMLGGRRTRYNSRQWNVVLKATDMISCSLWPFFLLFFFLLVVESTLLFIFWFWFALNFFCLKRWMLEYCISYNSSSVVSDFHSMAWYGVLYSRAVDQRHFMSLLESLVSSQCCLSKH